jgi:invasion protein IalB
MDTSTIVDVVSDFIRICVEHPGMMIQIDDQLFKGIYRASVQPETCVREAIIIIPLLKLLEL